MSKVADLSGLKLKPTQVKTDPESLKYYGKDWTTYFDIKPSAIVFPESTEDVVTIVKWAVSTKTSLVPSGGRTGLSGGACALNQEVVVSFERMNKFSNFNALDMTVTCEAGVVTEELQKYAHEKGLFYPVDFAARGSSQVGGNVATNAGGIKVLRYGLTRQYVGSLKVVTGTGEVLELNRSLIKNATGYDLRQLFIGSEGTLGFITEITFHLLPAPPPYQVILVALPELDSVMKVFDLFRGKLNLTAFEMFSELALQKVMEKTSLPHPFSSPSPFYVVMEMEANAGSEEKILEVFTAAVEAGYIADGHLSQSETQAKTFWRYREDISESLASFSPYKNDISVKISDVPAFMGKLDQILRSNYPTWEVVWFGHIGDGNLHINILRPENLTKDSFVQECRKVDQLIFQLIKDFEGSISAEHGVGLTKKSFLSFSRSTAEISYMRQIKKIFDPMGIVNPGKIFD
ncbi:MAG: FAD-binding oxidoreductase [Bdellovibrionota bacterium]